MRDVEPSCPPLTPTPKAGANTRVVFVVFSEMLYRQRYATTSCTCQSEQLVSQVRMDGDTEAGMSAVQNNRGTTAGGVTGRGFAPGTSGNPGGRPKGLTRRVRELVGDDGTAIAEFMYSVMADEGSRTADRLEAARWLADRGFGRPPQDVELAMKGQEALDVHAFAAFAAKYLPTEMLDEMILCVEATMEAERALPQRHIPLGHS